MSVSKSNYTEKHENIGYKIGEVTTRKRTVNLGNPDIRSAITSSDDNRDETITIKNQNTQRLKFINGKPSNSTSQVKTLDISNNGLTKLSSSIGIFPNLKVIDASHNKIKKISGKAMQAIARLRLEEINLSHTSLQENSSNPVKKVKDWILGNRLSDTLKKLGTIQTLEKLDLRDTNIRRGNLPSQIGNLTKDVEGKGLYILPTNTSASSVNLQNGEHTDNTPNPNIEGSTFSPLLHSQLSPAMQIFLPDTTTPSITEDFTIEHPIRIARDSHLSTEQAQLEERARVHVEHLRRQGEAEVQSVTDYTGTITGSN